jgi:hypothetical protein
MPLRSERRFHIWEVSQMLETPESEYTVLKADVTTHGTRRTHEGKASNLEKSEQGDRLCNKEQLLSAREKGKDTINPLDQSSQCGKDGQVLLAESLGEGEQLGKAGGSRLRAKSPRNLIFEFCSFDRSFRAIIICGDIGVTHEGKDPLSMLDQTLLEPTFLLVDQRHLKQACQLILIKLDDFFSLVQRNPLLPDSISGSLTFEQETLNSIGECRALFIYSILQIAYQMGMTELMS